MSQITVSSSSITFDETKYKETSEKELTISNEYLNAVDVVLRFFNPDFSVADSAITIAGRSNEKVKVLFTPRHNINYNSELVVVTNSKTGSVAIDLKGKGKYDSYYASTFNLFEEDLKNELKSVISKNYVNLGYNGARDAMYGSIDNKSGKVECVYTGRTATFNSRSGANSNSFNCEHTWPQSLFSQREPERADIHHLFPTDVNANGRRSNYRFGVVTGSTSWSEGGSKLGGSIFEPRDEHKGDVARAMFYFAIRYQNYSSFLTNQESVLRQWSISTPPTQQSLDRNNAIFARQKNRNPFVDYPEYLERITSISSTSKATPQSSIRLSASSINLSKIEYATAFDYQLVITNDGNQKILFTSVSNTNSNVSVPTTAFELSPGESHILEISINPTKASITDEITIRSSNITLKVPLFVAGYSSVQNVGNHTFTSTYRNGQLIIKGANGYSVYVCDASGRQVFFDEIQSDFTEINIPSLQGGVYFVQAIGRDATSFVRKVFIP